MLAEKKSCTFVVIPNQDSFSIGRRTQECVECWTQASKGAAPFHQGHRVSGQTAGETPAMWPCLLTRNLQQYTRTNGWGRSIH